MNEWFLSSLAFLSAALVGVGLFLQVAAIIRQKRSLVGYLYKLIGLASLLWALWKGRESYLLLIAVFLISLAIFLVILTLARDKLLR